MQNDKKYTIKGEDVQVWVERNQKDIKRPQGRVDAIKAPQMEAFMRVYKALTEIVQNNTLGDREQCLKRELGTIRRCDNPQDLAYLPRQQWSSMVSVQYDESYYNRQNDYIFKYTFHYSTTHHDGFLYLLLYVHLKYSSISAVNLANAIIDGTESADEQKCYVRFKTNLRDNLVSWTETKRMSDSTIGYSKILDYTDDLIGSQISVYDWNLDTGKNLANPVKDARSYKMPVVFVQPVTAILYIAAQEQLCDIFDHFSNFLGRRRRFEAYVLKAVSSYAKSQIPSTEGFLVEVNKIICAIAIKWGGVGKFNSIQPLGGNGEDARPYLLTNKLLFLLQSIQNGHTRSSTDWEVSMSSTNEQTDKKDYDEEENDYIELCKFMHCCFESQSKSKVTFGFFLEVVHKVFDNENGLIGREQRGRVVVGKIFAKYEPEKEYSADLYYALAKFLGVEAYIDSKGGFILTTPTIRGEDNWFDLKTRFFKYLKTHESTYTHELRVAQELKFKSHAKNILVAMKADLPAFESMKDESGATARASYRLRTCLNVAFQSIKINLQHGSGAGSSSDAGAGSGSSSGAVPDSDPNSSLITTLVSCMANELINKSIDFKNKGVGTYRAINGLCATEGADHTIERYKKINDAVRAAFRSFGMTSPSRTDATSRELVWEDIKKAVSEPESHSCLVMMIFVQGDITVDTLRYNLKEWKENRPKHFANFRFNDKTLITKMIAQGLLEGQQLGGDVTGAPRVLFGNIFGFGQQRASMHRSTLPSAGSEGVPLAQGIDIVQDNDTNSCAYMVQQLRNRGVFERVGLSDDIIEELLEAASHHDALSSTDPDEVTLDDPKIDMERKIFG